MSRPGPKGIVIEGGGDCVIDDCGFFGLGTAVEFNGGHGHRLTNSHFRKNDVNVHIRDGRDHTIAGNSFEGRAPSEREGLAFIRKKLALDEKLPDREILSSLHSVLRERDNDAKQRAARKTSLANWLIRHGTDVNVAVNTIVTLAAAVSQWFRW
jgi:hypothetical protein